MMEMAVLVEGKEEGQREDLERVGAKEGNKIDRVKWKILSRCGDPE